MAFRSSSSLFSLQPSQGRGLSSFGAYGADLPKLGSMQEFIDPTLDGGEGLSLDATGEPLDLSTLQQADTGELVSSVTGARIPGQVDPEAPTSGAQVPRPAGRLAGAAGEGEQETSLISLAKGALGTFEKGSTAYEKLRNLFGGEPALEGAPGETKFDFDVPEIDWESPEAVSQWLASNPESQYSLFGTEIGQSSQDVDQWLTQASDFDLGDTKLDSSFLDQYGGVAPTTGTVTGGVQPTTTTPVPSASPALDQTMQAVGTAGTVASAAGSLLKLFNMAGLDSKELDTAATALGGIGNVAKIVQLANSGQLMSITGAASGAGAVAAVLSAVATLTGNEDLGKAANALGLVASGVSTASAISGAVGAAGATAASTAAASGALAAGVSGLGVAAGAAMAPIAAFLIVDALGPLFGKKEGLLGVSAGIGEMMDPLMGDYAKFAPALGKTLTAENLGLSSLAQALPYAQSDDDVAQILSQFKAHQAQRIGGYGEGSDRFTIPALPGAGGSKHEGMQTADFGRQTESFQQLINELLARLPDTGGTGQDLYNAVMSNIRREDTIGSGLDLDMLQHLDPTNRARVLSQFQPSSNLGAVSPQFSQLGLYAPRTWTQLPSYDASLLQPQQAAAQQDPYALDEYGNPLHPESWGVYGTA